MGNFIKMCKLKVHYGIITWNTQIKFKNIWK